MNIKKQFVLLSLLIISIPILCYSFIIIHTYIHSPNRFLNKGSISNLKTELPQLSEAEIKNLGLSIKMLPRKVEAVIFRTTDHKIIYSSMPDIPVGTIMNHDEFWDFTAKTSDKYFYQFSKVPSAGSDIILLTRLPLERVETERRTKYYLKVLFVIILITAVCLTLIILIAKKIFKGLKTIEKSSKQLSEGHLENSLSPEVSPSKINEFTNILNCLEKMRCELLEMHTRKNRFVMGISHDLRTPVSIIKGYSEAIMDKVITGEDEIHNSMELIEHKATQLEEMIDTLINYMKFNDSEIKEKLIPASITTLIKNYAKYVEITCKVFKRNVKTDIQLPKEDIIIPLNEQLIHRSFENLLSNAIRYTKENDLIEIVSYIKAVENQNFIILQVKDTGPGIDKKDMDYIFDTFYRGTNSRKEEGMGIGLSVVKSIMDTHGWTISVQSQKKKGTCFTIKIPY